MSDDERDERRSDRLEGWEDEPASDELMDRTILKLAKLELVEREDQDDDA